MYISTTERGLTKEVKIPMPWGYVAGKTWGSPCNSPVLCIHGWMDNANTFDTLIPLLPKDLYYVCIDIPGQGLSSNLPPGIVYSMHVYTSTVYRIMQYYRWKTVSFLGHSLGAYICSQVAVDLSDYVDKLIIIDTITPIIQGRALDLKLQRKRINHNVSMDGRNIPPQSYPVATTMERMFKAIPGITEEGAEILLERATINGMHTNHVDPRQKIKTQIQLAMPNEIPVILSCIKAEVMNIFTHGFYDEIESFKTMDLYLSCFDSFAFHQVKWINGNHFVHLLQPENMAGHITNMLQRPPRKDLKPLKLLNSQL